MRKLRKNAAAVAMAKKRWAGIPPEERKAQAMAAASVRSQKAAERRAAREAQATEPDAVEA